ncbi:hypothetical protein [Brevibacterium epidermidis]|uniref:hypothetical protein n=1 Tax=Brevibacterium epidermidis TaxID=1698 RepID=UPI000785FEF3|nr:hypothetical protein [Brevibacterium epidermidis]
MHTTRLTIRKTVRNTAVSVIAASMLLLTGCSNDGSDEAKNAPLAPESAEAVPADSTTTTTEAPTEEPEDDGDDELANEVVTSLKKGDIVTHPDDAKFWGTGVVREEVRPNTSTTKATEIMVDYGTVPTSEFTFEAEGKCIIARPKSLEIAAELTYLDVPGAGSASKEVDEERAADTGHEWVDTPMMFSIGCVKSSKQIEPLTLEEHQAEVLAELEEGGFAEVGRKLRGDELEIVERAEDK